jgi:hypothetical protein
MIIAHPTSATTASLRSVSDMDSSDFREQTHDCHLPSIRQ